MASEFAKKVQALEDSISNAQTKSLSVEACLPTLVIIGIIAPLIVFLVLFFVAPRFVKKKDGIKSVRSSRKVFLGTVIATLLIWSGLYVYAYMSGGVGTGMVCSFN